MGKVHVKSLVGAWAFLIGVILALLLGVLALEAVWVTAVLVILGLMVGFLNVGTRESKTFLLAGVSLVIVSYMGSAFLTGVLGDVLNALLILFIPATIVVALKTVFSVAKG